MANQTAIGTLWSGIFPIGWKRLPAAHKKRPVSGFDSQEASHFLKWRGVAGLRLRPVAFTSCAQGT